MSSIEHNTGKGYWRSLNELAETAEFKDFMAREFPSGATELLGPSTRRSFLKVMGASLALAGLGLTSCRWPEEKIVPLANQPEGFVPGSAVNYATSMDIGGHSFGLLATSYDGRPIKLEGNGLHPVSLGKSSMQHQASLLDLYDIDRSKAPVASGTEKSWEELETELEAQANSAAASGGSGLAFLSRAVGSPSLSRMREEVMDRFPQAQWFEYEPVSQDNALSGAEMVFGRRLRATHNLRDINTVVSFGSDFTFNHPAAVRYSADFMPTRKADGYKMSRLFVFESEYTCTGSIADHRVPVRQSALPAALAQLANVLFNDLGLALPAGADRLASQLGSFASAISNETANEESTGEADAIKAAAHDLMAYRGTSALFVGDDLPPAAHALGIMINDALGNMRRTVNYVSVPQDQRDNYSDQIKALCDAMNSGSVDKLVILGGNPVYDAPADAGFEAALGKTKVSIHLGTHYDETASQCIWHIPEAHFLESWGDGTAYDGSYTAQQPLIAPFYDGMSAIELASKFTRSASNKGHDIVRSTFGSVAGGGNTDKLWRQFLHDGLVAGSSAPSANPQANYASLGSAVSGLQVSGGDFELLLNADSCVYDGRFANNGWLQECPDPSTKVTWDNTLCISYSDAMDAGIAHGDLIRLKAGNAEMDLPAYVMPGLPKGQLVTKLGYGRSAAGQVGSGVGFNTYTLFNTNDGAVLTNVSIGKTGGTYLLAETQDHFVIDAVGFNDRERRLGALVREANLSEIQDDHYNAGHYVHHPDLISLWNEHEYGPNRWGMSIDLSVCNGCSACVVACQAENNIPVVGKQRVAEGREMHWIRVDRYFRGDPSRPSMLNQPVTCHQCENAPCEQVCPVAATIHTEEGLNDMVYNRCVGTRYCSNNCPYKVRRFNYFSYQRNFTETQKLQLNPEVTVRSRGVMEKCTYCVQRIQKVKIDAKNARREIQDGEILTACQQACPSDAIVFGNLADANSRVARLQGVSTDDPSLSKRSYGMLAELNVKPRTRYMAKVHNPAEGSAESKMHFAPAHGDGHGGHSDDHGGGYDDSHNGDHGENGNGGDHGKVISLDGGEVAIAGTGGGQ